ncbi:rhodanese-like domain-containing protein [Kitasatospora sp. NPDC090091]|uniref:rhodanese-like domain-containing protein n=1 Tax=Kitasatospora sp. NPDC090091 TaxID=3364081 RepID=UPI0037F7DAD1
MPTPTALTPEQAHPRLSTLTVVDVRTHGEYAAGHVPGALNVPLDQLGRALPALREAAGRGGLLVVCASGARSGRACTDLAAAGIPAATLVGGTSAWAAAGHAVDRPEGAPAKAPWPMDRQIRFAAGVLVLAGLLVDLVLPGARWFSAAVGAGLLFSAVTNTCAMGAMLSRLPHNRPRTGHRHDLAATLNALATGRSEPAPHTGS